MGDFKLPHDEKKRALWKTGNEEVDNVTLQENKNRLEQSPPVLRTGNDYITETRHNSSIVLGRDYEYDIFNDTDIGMVDISAGRVPNTDSEGLHIYDKSNPGTRSSGDFISDSARVYVSQKTDIDDLLGFTDKDSIQERSAVCAKADAVRIVSRDPKAGIRLIVKPDATGWRPGENSQGGSVGESVGGVQLIGSGYAGADYSGELEPMVRAHELSNTLAQMVSYIEELETVVLNFISYQKRFNSAVMKASDIEAFYTAKGLPDPNKIKTGGKTSLEIFSYVETSGKSLRIEMGKFKEGVLQQTKFVRDGKTEYLKTGEPKFASKYHKLN